MKRTYILFLILLSTLSFQFCYSQQNITIDTQYRMKPDKSVAKENYYFGFFPSDGILYTNDKDLSIQKQYYIKFKDTFYDNANLFNVAYMTDAVQQTLKRRPNSELGAFSIIYDEKNGQVVGVRIVTQDSSEIYLTEFGAKLLNKI
ncbi:hypothetical protein QFZ37_003789 [Chryseobacterium ginsenosidimutans]|uniref:hypothetical protein n=1 Tax=Chryseobacterium ginsenosidimutans TaxID=687846 RepID=UPI00277DB923|nr:hypothetical protein [Chryseobacterium ginsenosidimutans]MDQ0595420.1 hypothetical protein [Chryseobacterium ginsenosidimutans]